MSGRTGKVTTRTVRIPSVPDGQIIHLAAEDRRWYKEPLHMRVSGVRTDLISSSNHDKAVWVEGIALDEQGRSVRPWQELIRLDLLGRLVGQE
jgi:hypothetical protein